MISVNLHAFSEESMHNSKALFAALLLTSAPLVAQATKVTQSDFGKTAEGAPIRAFTLADRKLTVKIISFGAHITSVQMPDKSGKVTDVVLGYDSMEGDHSGYNADSKTYMGSVVGRYGNRIAKGRFSLDGHEYTLSQNDHGNTLHGGVSGFDRKNWTARPIPSGVELSLVSNDGDMGFPGTVTAHVRYTLTGDRLRIEYSATTTKPTVINLTNHSYFNLAGGGDILGHILKLDASRFTPIDAGLIPTGELPAVAGTPFDFLKPTAIGDRIHADHEQLKLAGGYDHNWVLDGKGQALHEAAVVTDPGSGRTLTVLTTEPGVQFYSGNFLDGALKGRSGSAYNKYAGLCLETQHYPDSPNHPAFPSTTLRPGKVYRSSTVFQFTMK